MTPHCPKCAREFRSGSELVRFGFYFRTNDSRSIQRYRCKLCKTTCSNATFSRWFRQKKLRYNEALRKHFAKLGSIRGGAETLSLNRKTMARKLVLLGFEAEERVRDRNLRYEKARVVEFDDLETFEHTRCKPLSVTLAVQKQTRRILDIEVSRMPAKGLLAEKSRQKYGWRPDERPEGWKKVFSRLQELVHEEAQIRSDSNPHYPFFVKKYFPEANHVTYLSRKGSNVGGGELKEGRFDPLFAVNHTCASKRMNVTRLLRKTWYTTKRPDRLRAHLFLYADFHNARIEKKLRAVQN